MNKQRWILGLLSALALMVLASPSEANFVQCPVGGGNCSVAQGVTDASDIINGSQNVDQRIDGLGGDDLIFGNDSPDDIIGRAGNDIIFGGLGSDIIVGSEGDDIILPGPDTFNFSQNAGGRDGNDTFNVVVSEVTSCLFISGAEGIDVVNLIGFGPYSVSAPFDTFDEDGEPDFILIVDPITGGRIFVEVSPDEVTSTEIINGLLTPNPTILTHIELEALEEPCPTGFFQGG
jgi:hypothetical protein